MFFRMYGVVYRVTEKTKDSVIFHDKKGKQYTLYMTQFIERLMNFEIVQMVHVIAAYDNEARCLDIYGPFATRGTAFNYQQMMHEDSRYKKYRDITMHECELK